MSFLHAIPWYLEVAFVFFLMMTVLVAAHEYGHYLFARIFGMGVEEFAIGMGKKVTVWRRKTYETEAGPETTEFTVRALPVGGFVRIKGMIPEDDGSEVHIPGGFYSKAPWKRLLVLFAGPLFSVLAGLAVLVPMFAISGIDKPNQQPVIGYITKPGPAATAGIQPGDRILAIDGHPIAKFYDMVGIVSVSSGKSLDFEVARGKQDLHLKVTPESTEGAILQSNLEYSQDWGTVGRIGVGYDNVKVHPNFAAALSEAVSLPFQAVSGIVGMFTHPKTFQHSVGGPATIVSVVAAGTQEGIDPILRIAALLSISVGIMNLLPFVPLDGGQMIVAFAEMLRRGKRLSIRVQETLQNVGATLVVVLIMAVLFVDFKRFVFPEKAPFSSPSPSASGLPSPSTTPTP